MTHFDQVLKVFLGNVLSCRLVRDAFLKQARVLNGIDHFRAIIRLSLDWSGHCLFLALNLL